MKNLFIFFAFLGAAFFTSCEKDYTEFYSDNKPEIPVTFEGATTHGFNPYIELPVTQDEFSLTLTIPSNSGRQIKEISKVLAGSTAINAGGVRAGTYISSPIAGSGNKVTFNTSISEFRASSDANNTLVANFLSGSTQQLQIAFMFLVKLDNDQEIIPVPVQVWLKK